MYEDLETQKTKIMDYKEMAKRAAATMNRLNEKWCKEELERIKTNSLSDTNFDCSNCKKADCDPKTAFLTEMQALLKRYGAKINVWSGEDGDMSLTFKLQDNIYIRYPNEWCTDYKFDFPITPDNIFDYEKE